ncbi:probable 26S proteasome subunit rpt4 [Vigna umbellata]|uniref:probable 26S proteasome subunit rpt4 n=1 Tax=Vigna umbellata TaxID=87088 RepID=UPI001F5E63C4|nr:probable 26S proteasome subunit rpt4 [Vigna umbellata]XP_047177919.1 probable 26S proteasome subunit rpt4 [Vigna umbellata]
MSEVTDETERRRSAETRYRKKLFLLRAMGSVRGLGRRPILFLFFIFFHLQVYAVSNLFHSFDVVWTTGIALYSVRLLEEALKSSLAKTEQDLRYLEGAAFWVGRVVRPNGSERFIVESEVGFRYIVDYDRKVDKKKITEETRVFLHKRTLTIMGILPRQVYISISHYSWIR